MQASPRFVLVKTHCVTVSVLVDSKFTRHMMGLLFHLRNSDIIMYRVCACYKISQNTVQMTFYFFYEVVTDPTFLGPAANWLEMRGQCNGCLAVL